MTKVECPECGGSGKVPKPVCAHCGNKGYVIWVDTNGEHKNPCSCEAGRNYEDMKEQ